MKGAPMAADLIPHGTTLSLTPSTLPASTSWPASPNSPPPTGAPVALAADRGDVHTLVLPLPPASRRHPRGVRACLDFGILGGQAMNGDKKRARAVDRRARAGMASLPGGVQRGRSAAAIPATIPASARRAAIRKVSIAGRLNDVTLGSPGSTSASMTDCAAKRATTWIGRPISPTRNGRNISATAATRVPASAASARNPTGPSGLKKSSATKRPSNPQPRERAHRLASRSGRVRSLRLQRDVARGDPDEGGAARA